MVEKNITVFVAKDGKEFSIKKNREVYEKELNKIIMKNIPCIKIDIPSIDLATDVYSEIIHVKTEDELRLYIENKKSELLGNWADDYVTENISKINFPANLVIYTADSWIDFVELDHLIKDTSECLGSLLKWQIEHPTNVEHPVKN